MKKLFKNYLSLFSVILLLISSCKKDETRVIATSGTPGTLSASSTTLVLDKTKVNTSDTSVLFTVTKANYGFSSAETNVLQIDSLGDNWQNPQSITLSANSTTQAISTNDFNSLLSKLHLPPSIASQVQVRAMNSISNYVTSIYSNVVTLTVTPFSLASYIYVPGAYQGWSPNTADSLVSATSNGIYTGVINFTGTDLNFKITMARNWNGTNYGAGSGAGTVSTTGGNLLAPGDGGLLLALNTNNNTLTITPQWSIIGDATPGGWGTDTNMYLDKTTNTWYVTSTLVSDGTKALKFRFKNDWTVNLGGSNGTLTQGGSNITIPKTAASGDMYKVTLDPNANTYKLAKQ